MKATIGVQWNKLTSFKIMGHIHGFDSGVLDEALRQGNFQSLETVFLKPLMLATSTAVVYSTFVRWRCMLNTSQRLS